ncbi:family 20 glycosylhydrolase [Tamlana sp. 2201CG12-4]|uniref:family 20 glycosylhydrolase n=1 Tax=Tamlana sp. 2201CG12-4 TaxID=3112582 RepID=UPI002DB9D3C7|nr:family 20 glycosylhydrolase [Tamlana sp. 2201CG12-4]MEC3906673.1 family 20 glycosylhydrolase [Tamlana sp. 2201CG12-4]
MKHTFLCKLAFLLIIVSCTQKTKTFTEAEVSVVPKPMELALKHQSFAFKSSTIISVQDSSQLKSAQFLIDLFNKATGYEFKIAEKGVKAQIEFVLDTELEAEAYLLNITPNKIVIKSREGAGAFYGVQTLRQLLPSGIETSTSNIKEWMVPCTIIKDSPRFSWRGMHMDFSRHFFSLEEVKTFLDYMALYKLNKFHMHLTDDQGWRIEIKKYPLLTEKGAWRTESSHDKECNRLAKINPMYTIDKQHFHQRDGKKMYGGFFTQEQIKDIVNYAANLHIEVIPEIDMPGHFKSAIDNYPFLSCTGESGWGDHFSQPACLGKQTSYEFAKDILAEVVNLFPSDYIHIGGDEVNIASWKVCSHCQKAIKDNNLKDEHELQSFFNKNIEKFLNSKGKRLLGWDEIVEGGLTKDATVMWWRNWAPKARYIAADNGSDIIITPDFEYYFDFKNEATPLEKVYKYEPVPEDFTEAQTKQILGVQANLWSEYIPNFQRLQYQAFPRMLALAESGWTGKTNKGYDNFLQRMEMQYQRLDSLNITYYIPSVNGLPNKIGFIDEAVITLEAPLEDMSIHYTLDGSTPSKTSPKYTGPIHVKENATIKTIAYRGNVSSEIKAATIEKQIFITALDVSPKIGKINRWLDLDAFKIVEDIKLPKNPKWEAVSNIDLKGFEDKDQLSMVFKGYFLAAEDGLYEFTTKSDDGSLLYIGDKLVVDNGGNHAAILRDGMVALKKGWHPITIKFHEASGGSELSVWYKSPNSEKQLLKDKVLGY